MVNFIIIEISFVIVMRIFYVAINAYRMAF